MLDGELPTAVWDEVTVDPVGMTREDPSSALPMTPPGASHLAESNS